MNEINVFYVYPLLVRRKEKYDVMLSFKFYFEEYEEICFNNRHKQYCCVIYRFISCPKHRYYEKAHVRNFTFSLPLAAKGEFMLLVQD